MLDALALYNILHTPWPAGLTDRLIHLTYTYTFIVQSFLNAWNLGYVKSCTIIWCFSKWTKAS